MIIFNFTSLNCSFTNQTVASGCLLGYIKYASACLDLDRSRSRSVLVLVDFDLSRFRSVSISISLDFDQSRFRSVSISISIGLVSIGIDWSRYRSRFRSFWGLDLDWSLLDLDRSRVSISISLDFDQSRF